MAAADAEGGAKGALERARLLFESDTTLRGQLLRGAGSSTILKILERLLALALSLVLARLLEPRGFGIYTFSLSIVAILGVPVQLGLPNLVVREVARFKESAQWDLLRGLLQRSYLTVGLVSTVVLLGVLAVEETGLLRTDATQRQTVAWACLLLPIIGMNRLRESALLGLGFVTKALVPERLILPVAMLAGLGAWGLLGDLGPTEAMAIHVVAAVITLIYGLLSLVQSLPEAVRAVPPRFMTKIWMQSALQLSLLAGLNIILSQTDIFMLGVLATKEDVGLYRVAFSGGALVLFFYAAINTILRPHIARLHSSGDTDRLQRMVTTSTRAVFLGAIPIVLALTMFGRPILGWFFGHAYQPAYAALAVLCLAQLFNVATGPVYDLLNMTGYERETVKGVALSAVVNVVLNAVMIPRLGVLGAAVATTVSIVLVNSRLVAVAYARTAIWSPAVLLPERLRSRGRGVER